MGVAGVGSLPGEPFGFLPVPGLLPHLSQEVQGEVVAIVGGDEVWPFGFLSVPVLLPHQRQG